MPELSYDQIDALVDVDPIALRDLAWKLQAERDEALKARPGRCGDIAPELFPGTGTRAVCMLDHGHPSDWHEDGDGSRWVYGPRESYAEVVAERDKAVQQERQAAYELGEAAAELDAARALAATCSCGTSPETYEGPEPDCAVHGAVRALNEAMAELARLRPAVEAAKAFTEAYQVALIPVNNVFVGFEAYNSRFDELLAAVDQMAPQDEAGPPEIGSMSRATLAGIAVATSHSGAVDFSLPLDDDQMAPQTGPGSTEAGQSVEVGATDAVEAPRASEGAVDHA